jgi:hypothetical protein
VSLFVWVISFDLSGVGAPANSYATAGLGLRVTLPRKPLHYVKVETPTGAIIIIIIIMLLFVEKAGQASLQVVKRVIQFGLESRTQTLNVPFHVICRQLDTGFGFRIPSHITAYQP